MALARAHSRDPARWRAALGLCLLFVAGMGVLGVFARGHVDNLDAVQAVYAARSLHLRGDLGLPAVADEHTLAAEGMIRAKRGGDTVDRDTRSGMEGPGGEFYVWFPVGYQLWLTPAAALGESLAEAYPAPEARLRELEGRGYGDLFWTMFVAGMMPLLGAAGGVVVLFLLGRELGLTVDGALLMTGVTAMATQYWPMMLENLSDGPGLTLLLAATLQVIRWLRHGRSEGPQRLSASTLFWAGNWSGLAVLMRYPHGLSVLILTAFVLWGCRGRTGSFARRVVQPVLTFALGGLPWLVVLLVANWLRFGDATETGYGAADLGSWFNYNMLVGLLFQLAAFGKGLLWLSPLLIPSLYWASFHRAGHGRAQPRSVTVMVWLLFVAPLCLFANTDGWQAGEAWGLRYVAPGMILLVALALSVARPWAGSRATRVCFVLFAGLGMFASATGLVAPVRGYLEMAAVATRAEYQKVGVALPEAAVPLHMFVEWQFSPLHGHWRYAAYNLDGTMQRGATAEVMAGIFGVEVPGTPRLPRRGADVGFRHWWWRWLEYVGGWTVWPWALASLLWGLGALLGARRLLLPQGAEAEH